MATAKKTTKKSATKPAKKAAKRQDAIAMLRADHKVVSGLFEAFKTSRSAAQKKKLVAEICRELKIHTQIEDEIFYPAFQAALRDHTLVPEAKVEHQSVKDLIAQVEGVDPSGDDLNAKVTVMGEFVKHHVKEEQNEMFKKAKASKLDLVALGARMLERKNELMAAAS